MREALTFFNIKQTGWRLWIRCLAEWTCSVQWFGLAICKTIIRTIIQWLLGKCFDGFGKNPVFNYGAAKYSQWIGSHALERRTNNKRQFSKFGSSSICKYFMRLEQATASNLPYKLIESVQSDKEHVFQVLSSQVMQVFRPVQKNELIVSDWIRLSSLFYQSTTQHYYVGRAKYSKRSRKKHILPECLQLKNKPLS